MDDELSTPAQPIPWYLQEDTPVSEEPVSSRDHLPNLPENPPKILQPLLEYTFKDLGLDNLKLIDLRNLQIPAALGANVIMLVGTARSVKHLNVSADRLCRWMRGSTWKLSPYADGLLGRNELKIKLRRKARRARAATQAGAILEEKDDGITTGWICVNAGVVEEDHTQPTLQEEGIEGFGSIGRGTRVVVQMFTEEKRAEVDIETLWEKRLQQAERERQRISSVSSETPEEVGDPATENRLSSDNNLVHSRPAMSFPFEQRRSLHISRRRQMPLNKDAVERPDAASESPSAASRPSGREPNMDYLFERLSDLPDDVARHELGIGKGDMDSSRFLRSFHQLRSHLSPAGDAAARIKFLSMAIHLKHPSYSKGSLWKEFIDYVRCGYHFSDEQGLLIVSAMLTPRALDNTRKGSSTLPREDIELAMRVLEQLSLYGVNVLNMKVFNMLYTASRHTSGRAKGRTWRGNTALTRIQRVVEAFNIPFDPKESRVFMFNLLEDGNYNAFWPLWYELGRSDSPRTREDYVQLFRLHAQLRDPNRARDCVSNWEGMMAKENPPVSQDEEITKHIQACLALGELDHRALKMQQKFIERQELVDL